MYIMQVKATPHMTNLITNLLIILLLYGTYNFLIHENFYIENYEDVRVDALIYFQ